MAMTIRFMTMRDAMSLVTVLSLGECGRRHKERPDRCQSGLSML